MHNFWAKTCKWVKTCPTCCDTRLHPLILHMLDVAASAEAILAREPETTRQRIAAVLGLPWETAKPWLLVLIACHDLGKACSGFQLKWEGDRELLSASGLRIPPWGRHFDKSCLCEPSRAHRIIAKAKLAL